MQSKIIYKIRHKLTGEWKYQGIDPHFTSDFWVAGAWDNMSPLKALFTRHIKCYSRNNSSYCKKVLADMVNWEIVSYNVSAEEAGVIDPAL